MRIAHVCRVGWPRVGGMERAVHELARDLRGRGHDTWVVTLERLSARDERLADATHDGVAYRRIRGVGSARYPIGVGLARAVHGADLVHVHGLDGLLDVAVRRLSVPVGVSTHGGYFHTRRSWRVKQLWLRTITRSSLARCAAVWFTSQADADRLAVAGVEGEILGNGVDLTRLRPGTRAPQVGRHVILGRVVPHKGHLDALRVLAAMPAAAHLDVVGPLDDPDWAATLMTAAARLGVAGRVRWHGGLSDSGVRAILAWAETAWFPSRGEGFGRTLVEAMAAGVPVVVGTEPALRGLVRCGVDALCTDFSRPDRAAADLARWQGGDHRARVAAAKATAAGYGWEVMGARWENAYRAVLGA